MPQIYESLEKEDQCDLDEVKNSKGHKMLVMYFDLKQDRILQVMVCKNGFGMLVHLEKSKDEEGRYDLYWIMVYEQSKGKKQLTEGDFYA